MSKVALTHSLLSVSDVLCLRACSRCRLIVEFFHQSEWLLDGFSPSEISRMGLNILSLVEIFNSQLTSRASSQTKDIRQGDGGVLVEATSDSLRIRLLLGRWGGQGDYPREAAISNTFHHKGFTSIF